MQSGPNVGLRAFGAQAVPSLLDFRLFLNFGHFLIKVIFDGPHGDIF